MGVPQDDSVGSRATHNSSFEQRRPTPIASSSTLSLSLSFASLVSPALACSITSCNPKDVSRPATSCTGKHSRVPREKEDRRQVRSQNDRNRPRSSATCSKCARHSAAPAAARLASPRGVSISALGLVAGPFARAIIRRESNNIRTTERL